MADRDLIAWVQALDRCWIERRFDDLSAYLASDVVMVAPGGTRIIGLDAAVASYREFMARCILHRFDSADHVATIRGDTAIVEYRWRMAWSDAGQEFDAVGREALVLACRADDWRILWRMQVPA